VVPRFDIALYRAFDELEQMVNLVSIDSKLILERK
jgi:hypothetical protein